MATNNTTKAEPQHPPLARDTQGNLVAVPDGAAAWRLCRQTTGRPKEIVGPDKRTLRFPLETTSEELAELCGPDVYRVYALDDVGKVLDYVVTVDLTRDTRESLRNGAPDQSWMPAPRASVGPSSDLRYALETMGQMMRANSEALRAVTEAQAGWVKSIASARGFFRNGSMPIPMPEATHVEKHADEEDEEPAQGKTIYDVLSPLAEHWAPSVKPLMSMLAEGAGVKALVAGASEPGLELRELVDLRYAAEKGKAKREAKQAASTKASLQARVVADPKLMAHFLAIKELLEPEEAEKILALGERISEEQQEWLLAQVSAVSPAEAAAVLRTMLAELSAVKVSTDSVE